VDDEGGDSDHSDLLVVSEAGRVGQVREQLGGAQSPEQVAGARKPTFDDQPFQPVLVVEGNLDGRRAAEGPAHDEEIARIAAIFKEGDEPAKDRVGVFDDGVAGGDPRTEAVAPVIRYEEVDLLLLIQRSGVVVVGRYLPVAVEVEDAGRLAPAG